MGTPDGCHVTSPLRPLPRLGCAPSEALQKAAYHFMEPGRGTVLSARPAAPGAAANVRLPRGVCDGTLGTVRGKPPVNRGLRRRPPGHACVRSPGMSAVKQVGFVLLALTGCVAAPVNTGFVPMSNRTAGDLDIGVQGGAAGGTLPDCETCPATSLGAAAQVEVFLSEETSIVAGANGGGRPIEDGGGGMGFRVGARHRWGPWLALGAGAGGSFGFLPTVEGDPPIEFSLDPDIGSALFDVELATGYSAHGLAVSVSIRPVLGFVAGLHDDDLLEATFWLPVELAFQVRITPVWSLTAHGLLSPNVQAGETLVFGGGGLGFHLHL
jgi:hypothetical protein